MRTFIYFVSSVMLLPVGLKAQTASLSPSVLSPAAVYASRGQLPIQYGGKSAPPDLSSFGFDGWAIDDDSVFSSNPNRVGNEAPSFSPRIALQSERRKISPDYSPSLLLYPPFDQDDGLNHGLDPGTNCWLGTHFTLVFCGSRRIQAGGFQPVGEDQVVPGLRLPTDSNRTGDTSAVKRGANTIGLPATSPGIGGSGEPAFIKAVRGDERGRNAGPWKIIPIILSLANHAAVTWDVQTTNHFFHHYPEGFKPIELDPIMRPFAGKAVMYPMANLLLAGPVDFLLFKTRHSSKQIRVLSYVAASIWVGLEVHQSIVNMRNERVVPMSGPPTVFTNTR